jgi:hypothetical protein
MGTREAIIEFRNQHLCYTEQEIATHFGVTRQWVSKVLIEANDPNAPAKRDDWGKAVTCPKCGGRKHSSAGLCGNCNHSKQHVTLTCDYCNSTYEVQKSDFESMEKKGQEHHFCSNSHKGLYYRGKNVRR